jgi:hypothetical protein
MFNLQELIARVSGGKTLMTVLHTIHVATNVHRELDADKDGEVTYGEFKEAAMIKLTQTVFNFVTPGRNELTELLTLVIFNIYQMVDSVKKLLKAKKELETK